MDISKHPVNQYLTKTTDEIILIMGRLLETESDVDYGSPNFEQSRLAVRKWFIDNHAIIRKYICIDNRQHINEVTKSKKVLLCAAIYDELSSMLDKPTLAICALLITEIGVSLFCTMDIESFLSKLGLGDL
jgi:hypothetical protein